MACLAAYALPDLPSGITHRRAQVLGPQALTLMCLGHIIGSGIFVLTGVAARTLAGYVPIVALESVMQLVESL